MFSLLKDWHHKFPLYISSLRSCISCRLSCYWKPHISARMKTTLACLLVLAVSVALSSASCYREILKPEKSDSEVLGCRDSKGELHLFGTSWRNNDCYDCHCSKTDIECCTSFATPVGYDQEKCISIFNKETCIYKVLEKDDLSKECPVHSWVM